jgi:hypothetical protein
MIGQSAIEAVPLPLLAPFAFIVSVSPQFACSIFVTIFVPQSRVIFFFTALYLFFLVPWLNLLEPCHQRFSIRHTADSRFISQHTIRNTVNDVSNQLFFYDTRFPRITFWCI